MDFIVIHYGKDKEGKVWKKVVGRYDDKEQARKAGEEVATKIIYKGEWVSMMKGNFTDEGEPIGQFRFFNMWE